MANGGIGSPDWVKGLRARFGFTQKALADWLGVTDATIRRWENGQAHPNRLAINALTALEHSLSFPTFRQKEKAPDSYDPVGPSNATVGMAEPKAIAVDRSQAVGGSTSGVNVGRHREMDELKAALRESLSGRGRLVMLVGESGIGKTHTAEELASVARQLGAKVLWGQCPEERGAPPYWPWAQAIRSYVAEQEPTELMLQMGPGADDIAQIIPDVRELLPDLVPSPSTEDPEQARFRLFDSITSFLKRASQQQPLLLVLENLHWADPSSLRLLEFVAPELAAARVMAMGTYRDVDVSRDHPLFRTLGELARQRLYQRIILRGLRRDEVEQYMKTVGRVTLPQELVSTVYEHTEGNPLFLREVVRLLTEEGLLVPERLNDLKDWGFRLPEGIREVIGRRMDRLSPNCNEILTIASVIGRQFGIALLEQVVQHPQEWLLGVLEEALEAKIIEEIPPPVGYYQFSHTLVRQTLVAELSNTRKVRMHALIAQSLDELYGADAENHAAELAYHLGEAETVVGTEKLVHYLRLAGEQALDAYAYEEARAHFQRALAAKETELSGKDLSRADLAQGARDAETADLLFGLGRAWAATHQVGEALANLDSAFEYYARAGDVERMVALAGHPYIGSLTQQMTQLRRRAVSLVPPDSPHAGRLSAVYGLSLGMVGDYEGACVAFSQALAIAQRQGSAGLQLLTRANMAHVDGFHLRWQESLENSLQAIQLAAQANDLPSRLYAHFWAGTSLLDFGRPEDAQQHADAMLALLEKFRDRVWLARAYLLAYRLSHLTGDFQSARNFSERLQVMDPGYSLFLARRVQMEYDEGNFNEGKFYLEKLLDSMRLAQSRSPENVFAAMVILMVPRITGSTNRFEVAEKTAQAVLSLPSVTPDLSQAARVGLAMLAVQLGDAPSAAQQYAHLSTSRGRMIRAGTFTIARVLGLTAQTMGEPDLATAHFEDALAFCRLAGYRPELAWTCYEYATILNEGHQQKALLLLDEALLICLELGMKPLSERINSLRESIEDRIASNMSYMAGLTARQIQVLGLIAKGKTNREIARELVLSERTVERHTADIYHKVGARNRAEATAFALSHLPHFN